MNFTRAISILVIGASLGLGAAVQAQTLKNVDTPSEFPPASYKGKQYVDSKGCVYIRAGVDGTVSWVPRVTRDRKVICGYKPTNPNAAPTTASAQKLNKDVVFIAPAAKPSQAAIVPPAKPKASSTATATATVAAKPKTTTKTTTSKAKPATTASTAAAKPTTAKPKSTSNNFWNWGSTSSTASTSTAAPKPSSSAAKTTTKTTTKTPPKATTATTTTTTTQKSSRRTLGQSPRQSGFDAACREGAKSKYKMRCGPQAELPYSPGTGNPTAPAPVININRSGASLAAPVGTVVKQGQVASNVRVVPKHVYENRQLALTKTPVPDGYRRVFDDGRLNPYRAEQTFAGKAAMDAIWQEGVPRKLRREMYDGSSAVVSSKSSSTATTSSSAPVISTKSAPKEKAIRLSGQSYVQVATYKDKAAAQGAAKRIQSLGLPAKIGKYNKQGATYRIVLAGPFASSEKAGDAASKARGAGYSGAFVRN